ncbi:hypothetical protein TrRE_jg6665 [Triparma retinervis]|uniref:Uncharacterized protein n=1 Tax=Triparma retinervis TaxID=2557542 RepID=A0A9W6ZSW7_9STRA|nr:hypothetical protein TrRE_jg6665 [Triparma retinervis]
MEWGDVGYVSGTGGGGPTEEKGWDWGPGNSGVLRNTAFTARTEFELHRAYRELGRGGMSFCESGGELRIERGRMSYADWVGCTGGGWCELDGGSGGEKVTSMREGDGRVRGARGGGDGTAEALRELGGLRPMGFGGAAGGTPSEGVLGGFSVEGGVGGEQVVDEFTRGIREAYGGRGIGSVFGSVASGSGRSGKGEYYRELGTDSERWCGVLSKNNGRTVKWVKELLRDYQDLGSGRNRGWLEGEKARGGVGDDMGEVKEWLEDWRERIDIGGYEDDDGDGGEDF